jgi:hypothetical protein
MERRATIRRPTSTAAICTCIFLLLCNCNDLCMPTVLLLYIILQIVIFLNFYIHLPFQMFNCTCACELI